MKRDAWHSLLTWLSAIPLTLAVVTLLPRPASHPDLLGFRTVCAFAPGSTLVLLGLSLFFRMYRDSRR